MLLLLLGCSFPGRFYYHLVWLKCYILFPKFVYVWAVKFKYFYPDLWIELCNICLWWAQKLSFSYTSVNVLILLLGLDIRTRHQWLVFLRMIIHFDFNILSFLYKEYSLVRQCHWSIQIWFLCLATDKVSFISSLFGYQRLPWSS